MQRWRACSQQHFEFYNNLLIVCCDGQPIQAFTLAAVAHYARSMVKQPAALRQLMRAASHPISSRQDSNV